MNNNQNDPKQLDCVLYCKSSAALNKEIEEELKIKDKSIGALLGEQKDEDNEETKDNSKNST